MAHPHKKASVDGHNAKLKRMTDDYGLGAGHGSNKLAPPNKYKAEGPEDVPSFGADSTAPLPSAGRRSRQIVANPVATLRHGGKAAKRAAGGRTKGKGKKHGAGTHVNVIVAPQGAGAGGMAGRPPVAAVPAMVPRPMPPAAGGPPAGPKPPMGGAPMGGSPMAGAPGAAPPPGAMPPGVMPPRKRGGRVHPDEAEDKALIEKTLKKHHLVRKDGGGVEADYSRHEQGLKPPSGGSPEISGRRGTVKHHHMTAGAGSGEGRLERIGEKPARRGHAQVV